MEAVLLLVSFAIVLTGALIFTNAVEWIGHRLEVGVGAVGSILAAVGTAMPETLIAIVALLGVKEGSEDVAIGAIVGAPFLLATLAMGLVGLFAYLYRDKRDQGVQLNVHRPTLERDLVFFLVLFAPRRSARLGAAGAGADRGRRRLPPRLRLLHPPDAAGRGRGPERRLAQPADLRAARRTARRPGPGPLRAPAPGRARGDGRRRPPLRRGAAPHRREHRRRGPGAGADPGAAGDRAAGEGQQLLLGARRQGRAGARQHHRRDGLPVDDPGRDRPHLHRLGPELATRSSRSASASPAASSPTRACTWRGASNCPP